jgi:hypothetical protein
MKRVAVLFGSVLCVVVSGCKSTPSPAPAVPVMGSSSARAKLVGRWEGEYKSAATGRSGTIVFEFKKDVGRGDVLMMPKGATEPLRPAHPESAAGRDAQTKPDSSTVDETLRTMQVLNIRFIETSEGALAGVLDPYIDPNCNCEVKTSFNGAIHGDRIEGTFTSKPIAGGPEATGQWSVTRKSS